MAKIRLTIDFEDGFPMPEQVKILVIAKPRTDEIRKMATTKREEIEKKIPGIRVARLQIAASVLVITSIIMKVINFCLNNKLF